MSRFSISARLSAMMFLQFFVWGAWYVTIGNYMLAHGMGDLTHWPYTVNPLAAIVSPFFLGLVADRFFATEKVLGVLHVVGGVVMLLVPQATGNPTLFIGLLLVHNLCYMPTIGLANSLSFHNIQDQEKQFPLIRVFGTLGWIAAGLFVSFVLGAFSGSVQPNETVLPIYTAGFAGIVVGLYAFSLPHTPPHAAGQKVSLRSIVGLDALKALGSRSFYVFVASSLLICIPLAAYYNFSPILVKEIGIANVEATLSLGQISEVVFMLLMPLFFRRLGVKWMLMIGMGAWVLRYALFALAIPGSVFWMIVGGILLHGICYDFFFVTGYIYMDKKSTPAIRGQAQGLFVLLTNGVGMLIGAQIAGNLFTALGGADMTSSQWQTFWYIPAAFAGAILLFFALAFRDRVDPES